MTYAEKWIQDNPNYLFRGCKEIVFNLDLTDCDNKRCRKCWEEEYKESEDTVK